MRIPDCEHKFEEEIALRAGALVRCRMHSDVLLNAEDQEAMRGAYALGTAIFKSLPEEPGYHRRDLLDEIKRTVDQAPARCFICDAAAQWR